MIWVGTSGYNYPEWKGTFYPADLPATRMLTYYAERLATVEINYTFYRMPTEKVLAGWAAKTPDRFRLTLKAPRRITHDARLEGAEELTGTFCARAGALGDKLGVLLFQLPPFLRKDVARLEAFTASLPAGTRAAFEFRHASWWDDDVYRVLRARDLALCVADSERMSTPVVRTASYGYFRLRDSGYSPEAIARWADTIRHGSGGVGGPGPDDDTFVYFKHEDAGTGPAFARALLDALAKL